MKLLYTLFFFILFQSSFATTFYISPNGNDESGNGSIANPWKTLYKATTAVTTAGSIIHISAGTYTEILQCPLAVGVSIEGDGVTSVLKSSVITEWTELLNLRSDEGTNGNQHISNLKLDGQNLFANWGIYIAGRSNVSIHDITVVDFKEAAVLFGGRNDNVEGAPTIFATGNSFYNNTVLNCASFDGWGRGCLRIGGQDGMLIYNNIITQNQRRAGNNGYPVKHLNDGYNKGCKIYNNKFTRAPGLGFDFDFGIELNQTSGLEVYGNTFSDCCLDMNRNDKGSYAYSVWIHNNKFLQPVAPEVNNQTGIILEFSTNTAIIDSNYFDKVNQAIVFTPREGDIINYIKIENNTCNDIGFFDQSHKGFAIRIGEDGSSLYTITNLFINKNKFIASTVEKPYWGIGVLGAQKVNNIQIIENTIQHFSGAGIVASPASIIDTMIIKNNNFSANGYANKPSFNNGQPQHYSYKNNISNSPSIFTFTNLKMNILRPLYYATKSTSILVFIAVFASIFSLWFSRKENIYVYPMALIAIVANALLNFDQDFSGEIFIDFCFVLLCTYGLFLWSKRDKRKHRIIRITSLSKKESLLCLAVFLGTFLVSYFCISYFKQEFSIDTIPWANAFIISAAFMAMFLMARKKIESWYWWLITNFSSAFLFFIKNYILLCVCFIMLLLMSIAGLNRWKKYRR